MPGHDTAPSGGGTATVSPHTVPTREYRDVVDKSGWPRGPWDGEPDKLQWQDEATGLPCLIVRGPVGNLCGYVGVPPDHPWFEVDAERCRIDGEDVWPDVHWGLTFSGKCQSTAPEDRSICHVLADGSDDSRWWLGFDCAHSGDLVPGMRSIGADDVYRDITFVRAECAKLADQAANRAAPPAETAHG